MIGLAEYLRARIIFLGVTPALLGKRDLSRATWDRLLSSQDAEREPTLSTLHTVARELGLQFDPYTGKINTDIAVQDLPAPSWVMELNLSETSELIEVSRETGERIRRVAADSKKSVPELIDAMLRAWVAQGDAARSSAFDPDSHANIPNVREDGPAPAPMRRNGAKACRSRKPARGRH